MVKPDPRWFGRASPGGWVPISGIKVRSLVVLSNHSAFHRWSVQSAELQVLPSDECLYLRCAARTNGCLELRCRAFPPDGQVRTEWSRCPGSLARRARDSVAPLLTVAMSLLNTRTGCQSPPCSIHDCWIVCVCILSGNGGRQVIGVDCRCWKKWCRNRSLRDAVLEAS